MRIFVRMLTALAIVGLGLLAFLVWRGPEPGGIDDVWTAIFGPPDLGPVDFATLRRRSSPNDALACPPGVCLKARADLEPPVYAVPGERLRLIVAQVAQQEPDTELVFAERWNDQDRYVARTALMRFPDTVNVEIIGQGEGRSTLAVYSRSQIGYSDMGANRERIARWLARIEAAAKHD